MTVAMRSISPRLMRSGQIRRTHPLALDEFDFLERDHARRRQDHAAGAIDHALSAASPISQRPCVYSRCRRVLCRSCRRVPAGDRRSWQRLDAATCRSMKSPSRSLCDPAIRAMVESVGRRAACAGRSLYRQPQRSACRHALPRFSSESTCAAAISRATTSAAGGYEVGRRTIFCAYQREPFSPRI